MIDLEIAARTRPYVGIGGRLLHHWRLSLACVFVLLIGLPTLIVPLYTDQAVFALGARTILHGGFPYRDLWDVKPPGIYLVYLPAMLPFGSDTAGIRILDLANTVLAMGAVYLLARRLFSERAGIVAATLYGFAYVTRAGFDGLGQTESFLVLPLALALFLYPADDAYKGSRRAVESGVLLGLAFSIKFSAAFFVLALPAMELLLAGGPWRLGPIVRRLSLAAVGFLAVVAAFAVYLALGGALGDFIDIQRLHMRPYTMLHWSPDGESYLHFVGRVTNEYLKDNLFLTVPAGIAFFFALRGVRTRETLLGGLLVAAALAGVWVQGKLFPYHWLALLFPLALLAGHAIDRTLALYDATRPRVMRWGACGLVGAGLVVLTPSIVSGPAGQYRHFIGYIDGSYTSAENEAQFGSYFALLREAVDYMQTRQCPTAPKVNGAVDSNDLSEGVNRSAFFVWGNWPILYWWREVSLPNRFVYDTPLTTEWAPEKWRNELVDSLERMPPTYILVAGGGPQPWLTGTTANAAENLEQYPRLLALIENRYVFVWGNDLFRIYEKTTRCP